VLPYLYRIVSLHIRALKKESPETLTAGNPGLVYIRILCIVYARYVQDFSNEEHLPRLLELLKVLPKNGLRVFESVSILQSTNEAELTCGYRLRTRRLVHQDLGLLLRIRQQQLTNYQYHSASLTARPLTPNTNEVSHVSRLQVLLRNERDCDIAVQLFKHMSLLTSLAITLNGAWLNSSTGDKSEAGR
jgi:hypothetical protein